MSTDALGDRMKAYERQETELRFIPLLPIYARIDGRGFSKFTKGFARPYDERFRALVDGNFFDVLDHLRRAPQVARFLQAP